MKCQRGGETTGVEKGEAKELQLELELVHPLRDKPYRAAAWQRSILTVIMINLNH